MENKVTVSVTTACGDMEINRIVTYEWGSHPDYTVLEYMAELSNHVDNEDQECSRNPAT